jgi:flagellar motility protein MotE (MotC chaperone)
MIWARLILISLLCLVPVSDAGEPVPEAPQPEATPEASKQWKGAAPAVGGAEVAEEFQKRRSEIDAREHAVKQKEDELKKREAAVQEEISKLSSMRAEILGMTADQKKKQEERVAKLVETFERMSPKAASEMLVKMEPSLSVSAMQALSTEKLAKILNIMDPAQASQLSELMAGRRRLAEKGGEKK